MSSDEDQAPAGQLLKKVRGPVLSQAEAEAAYGDLVASYRGAALSFLFVPPRERAFRWKLELDCGCTMEMFTRGADRFPDGAHSPGLPPGQLRCRRVEEHNGPDPFRRIVEWVDREVVERPADPEELPEGYTDEMWAILRHPEPWSFAAWRVRLECGHSGRGTSDLEWSPEMGPSRVPAKRIREMRRELEELEKAGQLRRRDQEEREHERRMLDEGWPIPSTELRCYDCISVRRLVGYQRIGPLQRPRPPVERKPPDPEVMRKRLAKIEAEAAELRKALEEEPGDAPA